MHFPSQAAGLRMTGSCRPQSMAEADGRLNRTQAAGRRTGPAARRAESALPRLSRATGRDRTLRPVGLFLPRGLLPEGPQALEYHTQRGRDPFFGRRPAVATLRGMNGRRIGLISGLNGSVSGPTVRGRRNTDRQVSADGARRARADGRRKKLSKGAGKHRP